MSASDEGRRGRARGTRLELEVALALRRDGWVVGSMRRSPGGGDLIASRSIGVDSMREAEDGSEIALVEVRLIEVKGTSRPFERFGPADRESLILIAKRAGASAWLAWRPKGESLIAWYPADAWPGA